MKLDIICEDKDVFLVEESFESGIINEDVLGIVDNAIEAALGAVGFIPGIGEPADFVVGIKNLIQGDYIGAAIFFISMEPSPASDTIGKSLRIIQKIARSTKQEERLNKIIGWLVRKTNGRQSEIAIGLLNKAKRTIDNIPGKIDKHDEIDKEKGIIDKVVKYIDNNFNKIEKEFTAFINKIEEKAVNLEPSAGIDDSDVPDDFVDELVNEIKTTYKRLMDRDVGDALLYKKKLKLAAGKKPEVKQAYGVVFGDFSEIK